MSEITFSHLTAKFKYNRILPGILVFISFFCLNVSNAQISQGVANVVIPSGGFGIDGNLQANTPVPGVGDWISGPSGAGGSVLNSIGTPLNNLTTYHLTDLYSNSQDNIFHGGQKVNDNPNTWTWVFGSPNNKDDMNNALVHLATDAAGKKWIMISADRLSNNGDSYMDFEFLQAPLTKTYTHNSSGGGFSTPAPASTGGRTVGDLLLTVYFSNNGSPGFDIQTWERVGTSYDYVSHLSSLPAGLVYAAANTTSMSVPYPAFGTNTYAPKTFIEGAIDLTDVFGILFPCNDIRIQSLLVKTKASHSSSAALKDFFDVLPISVNIGNADAGADQNNCSQGNFTTFSLAGSDIAGLGTTVVSTQWSAESYTGTQPPQILNPSGLTTAVNVYGGTATMMLTVTIHSGTNSCTSSDEVVLTVDPVPTITFDPLPSVCVGSGSVALSALPHGGVFSGPYVHENIFTPERAGTFGITYTLTNPASECGPVPVTQPITVNVCTPMWSGLVNTNWYVPGNWVGNIVPASTDDVIIPPGCPNYPVLGSTTTVTCNDIDIQTGASVDVGTGGALTVSGDLNNSGTLTVESGGSLITSCSVTGIATVKRNISSDLGWHLLSSPVQNQEICNSIFAPSSGTFPGNISSWDFYKWMPNCPTPPLPAEHWRNLRTTTGAMNTADFGNPPAFVATKGYLTAYGLDWPSLKSFTGTLNTCDQVLSFEDIISPCSWELAGNPFPSAVSWELVTGKSNLTTDYYYVWNENKGGGAGYEYWKDINHRSSSMIDGNIPSMQGFFVKVDPAGSKTLGLPNSARVHDVVQDLWLKDSPSNRLCVTLSRDNHYDEAFIQFEEQSSVGNDRNDAEKILSMNADIPQVYSIIDEEQKTALNSLPCVSDGINTSIGIVTPADATYTLKVSGIETFSSLAGLILEDRDLDLTQDMLQNPVYTFTAGGNEDAGRFLLHFRGTIGNGSKDKENVNIYSSGKSVFITSGIGFSNARVSIANVLGQEILSRKLGDQLMNKIDLDVKSGYYIVKVMDATSVKTSKVFID